MLYIVSQNGLRIADLHTISIITPEHDQYEEDVYKVMVNGIEFARYQKKETVFQIIEDIKEFISLEASGPYVLQKD